MGATVNTPSFDLFSALRSDETEMLLQGAPHEMLVALLLAAPKAHQHNADQPTVRHPNGINVHGLRVGDMLLVHDRHCWCRGRIEEIKQNSNSPADLVHIKFVDWPQEVYDEWIRIDSLRLAPLGRHKHSLPLRRIEQPDPEPATKSTFWAAARIVPEDSDQENTGQENVGEGEEHSDTET